MKTIYLQNGLTGDSPILDIEDWKKQISPQRFSFNNDFGSFSTVELFLYGKNKFRVVVTVRAKKKDGTTAIKQTEKIYSNDLYNNFIADLTKRIKNPYKSKAQQRLFHALAAKGKISPDIVTEYDKESAGLDLPERVGNPNKSYPRIKTTKDIFKPNQYNKNWYAVKVNHDIQVNLSLSQDGKDYYISFSKGLMPLNEAVEKNWIASYSKKYDTLKEVKQYLVDYANHYLAYEYFPKDVYLYD